MNSTTGPKHFFGDFSSTNFFGKATSGVGFDVVNVVRVAGGNDESAVFALTGSWT